MLHITAITGAVSAFLSTISFAAGAAASTRIAFTRIAQEHKTTSQHFLRASRLTTRNVIEKLIKENQHCQRMDSPANNSCPGMTNAKCVRYLQRITKIFCATFTI